MSVTEAEAQEMSKQSIWLELRKAQRTIDKWAPLVDELCEKHLRAVDTRDLERLAELAHQPALTGEALALLEAGLDLDVEPSGDPDDVEDAILMYRDSMEEVCSCGWQPARHRGQPRQGAHGAHLARMLRLAREGTIELP